MSDYIFVYGTLLSQYDNYYANLLKDHSVIIGLGYAKGLLFTTDHYPGFIPSNENSEKVYGQVLNITSKLDLVLDALDEYEGVGPQFPDPNEYIRSVLPVYINKGQILKCWVYIYNHPVDHMVKIASGKYQDFTAPRD